ncbi:hypothetical protein FHT02_004149 [Sphingomonas xinjiangensis]|uniref:Uncharacterized protein n=1 Tax=Sphingomonas xinjiangensis TaxID=643568 RepID=A0A840YT90_9SPHN|nr:hypothetical protein [Sphingomonas xinjiangensis]
MGPMALQRPWMVRLATLRRCAPKLGEGLLDWVEVWAAGREEEPAGSDRLDHLANDWRVVARQVLHDHDIAAPEFGQEQRHRLTRRSRLV